VGGGVLASERRLDARIGLFAPVRLGLVELFALAHVGHDVGITRREKRNQLGAGIAWTLLL
jgi:hypothetical protein